MIQIDKTDKLYKYLSKLGVDDIDSVYMELATNGRFNLDDIREYLYADFDIVGDEVEIGDTTAAVVDYYNDLKKIKELNKKTLKEKLSVYHTSHDAIVKEEIINSLLFKAFTVAACYKTNHKEHDFMDIVQNANIALLKAVDKYDPESKLEIDDYILFYTREQLNKTYKEKENG